MSNQYLQVLTTSTDPSLIQQTEYLWVEVSGRMGNGRYLVALRSLNEHLPENLEDVEVLVAVDLTALRYEEAMQALQDL